MKHLSVSDFLPELVENGSEAVEAFKKNKYDIIFNGYANVGHGWVRCNQKD